MNIDEKNKRFTVLWTEAVPLISSYIYSLVPNKSDYHDILQNTAIAVMKKFDSYDEKRPFAGWAIGYARFEILSSKRKYARNPLVFQETIVDTITTMYEEMAPELDDRSIALKECINKVKMENKNILKLRYEKMLPFEEVSRLLQITNEKARTSFSRTKAFLKKCIENRIKQPA